LLNLAPADYTGLATFAKGMLTSGRVSYIGGALKMLTSFNFLASVIFMDADKARGENN